MPVAARPGPFQILEAKTARPGESEGMLQGCQSVSAQKRDVHLETGVHTPSVHIHPFFLDVRAAIFFGAYTRIKGATYD